MKIAPSVFLSLWILTFFNVNPVQGASSCVTTTCHPATIAFEHLHAPVEERDCVSCHLQRSKEHPVKGAKAFELAAPGGALCVNCHNQGKKSFQHAPVKDGDCNACHKPHGASGRFLLDAGEDLTPLCLGCHDSADFKQKFMHGPAAVGSCLECHDPHESDGKGLLTGSVRELCLKCHADFAASLHSAAVVHPPVKEAPCTACHNPHGAQVPMMLNNKMPDLCTGCHKEIGKKLTTVKVPHKPLLSQAGCASCHSSHFSKAKGLLPTDEKGTCLACHGTDKLGTPPLRNIKKEIEGKKFLHGPLQKGECKGCHDPHGSDYFRMLRGNYPAGLYQPYKEGSYDFCLKCHEKNLIKFADTTIYTKFRNGNQNLHYLHVANSRKGRSCRICHEPHASNGQKLISSEGSQFGDWKIPLNFKISPTGGSCAPGCHRAFKYDRDKPENYRAESKP